MCSLGFRLRPRASLRSLKRPSTSSFISTMKIFILKFVAYSILVRIFAFGADRLLAPYGRCPHDQRRLSIRSSAWRGFPSLRWLLAFVDSIHSEHELFLLALDCTTSSSNRAVLSSTSTQETPWATRGSKFHAKRTPWWRVRPPQPAIYIGRIYERGGTTGLNKIPSTRSFIFIKRTQVSPLRATSTRVHASTRVHVRPTRPRSIINYIIPGTGAILREFGLRASTPTGLLPMTGTYYQHIHPLDRRVRGGHCKNMVL